MKCSGMLGTLALAVTASALAVSDILVAPACAMAEEAATPLAVSPLSVEVRADGVDARLTAPRDRVEVGEAIPFVLTVAVARGIALSPPTIAASFGPFTTEAVSQSTQGTAEGSVFTCRFVARTYETGALETAPLEIAYTDATGATKTLTLAPARVEVMSIVGEAFDPAVFRDIKGPIDIATVSWWWWALTGTGLTAAAIAGWLLWRHRRAVAARSLPPHEWAMQSLAALELDGLVAKGQLHAYWVRLSDIVRQYIERRFEIAAPEQTTKEFLASVGNHPAIGAEHRHLLTDFLRAADMVKFAAHQPAATECARGLAAARGFVEDTTPVDGPAVPVSAPEEARP